MSLSVTSEARRQGKADDNTDVIDVNKGPARCRIPQRMASARQKQPPIRPKPPPEILRQKFDAIPQRYTVRQSVRAHSNESRPKSANRGKDESNTGRRDGTGPGHSVPRATKPERDRFSITAKRPSTIPRKVMNYGTQSKAMRAIITVPVTGQQKGQSKIVNSDLPDQETISKQERCEISDDLESPTIDKGDGSLCSQSDKMLKIKMNWQENMVQFEKMKNDLNERQKAIVELYALMRNTHSKMTMLGQKAILPPSEDLRIMNVAQLTAEQLLQLCYVRPDDKSQRANKPNKDSQLRTSLAIDVNKLYAMPTKLVATCEQTLFKRKEIIDWFDTLKTEDKGICLKKLSMKINEFNAENEMLHSSLEHAKEEFMKELREIIEFMRKTVNETVALQLRTEELTYTLSDLNSQNTDLRKQIHNSDHLRSQTNRMKVEELDKELKEERRKKFHLKDRLSRAEDKIRISGERTSQLEAALSQAQAQTRTLERTVQQLHDQNQSLQSEFDVELHKLGESIKENTMHLEEIAEAREKLQTEKEDLEKRLGDLSKNYNESLQTIKHDMNVNVAKLIEAENKNEVLATEKHNLEVKLKAVCSQLTESELRVTELTKEVQEAKDNLSHAMTYEEELSSTKRDLDIAIFELEDNRKRLAQQSKTIKEYENNIKDSIKLEENLKADLINKEEYISSLEKKLSLQEKQLQASECKMGSYREQLTCVESNIVKMQEDFGEFADLNELHEMVNEQRDKLLEATRQNGELVEELRKKTMELDQHIDTISEQEQLLEQRDNVIKMLSEKEEEHTNIIKLLRTNLEMRTQADRDLNQQMSGKNAEIEALITNVEKRKQQICQLEKIILTLQSQASMQRRKDQEKINLLEHKIAEYETYHMENKHNDLPSNNLDSIIRILEDELGTAFEPPINNREHDLITPKKKYVEDRRRDKLENFDYVKGNNNQIIHQNEQETIPTKIGIDNFAKKSYNSSNDEKFQNDNLDRKKATMNMDTQKWIPAPDPNINMYSATTPIIKDNNYPPFRGLLPAGSHLTSNLLSRNIQLLSSNQLRDDKKCKMFKIAGHKL